MPGFNQTGPSGRGPMTGWGRGRCNANRPEYEAGIRGNAGLGRGMGLGHGYRRGFGSDMSTYYRPGLGRNWATFMQTYPEDTLMQIDRLKSQAESMQRSLEAINARIEEMEKTE